MRRQDWTIRPIAPEEVERCARLMERSEPWLTLGRGYESGIAVLEDSTRERHVAVVGDEIAGFVVLVMSGALTGYLQTICVAPAFRGQGVGRALMAHAESLVFARYANLFLTVSDFNSGAQQFYRRLGYEVVGELRDYLIAGHSEILLRKTRGPIRGYRPQSSGAS
ncbi:MAG TPA: GNAT family N-acetyltransferase [Burkholderiales bacterium]|nr:GNAT family N-acetyltransferase [Burkholderiales bacterium]